MFAVGSMYVEVNQNEWFQEEFRIVILMWILHALQF